MHYLLVHVRPAVQLCSGLLVWLEMLPQYNEAYNETISTLHYFVFLDNSVHSGVASLFPWFSLNNKAQDKQRKTEASWHHDASH